MRKMSWKRRGVCALMALVMVLGILPAGILRSIAAADDALQSALDEAKTYIDGITINSSSNDPETVVKNFGTHFTWDNEKRENSKSYLFDWSYYNGVVFAGIDYIYDVTGEKVYSDYLIEYLSTMIKSDGTWANCTNNTSKQAAGYNSTHGADCYMTASLLLDAYKMTGDSRYLTMAGTLYADLDTAAKSYLLPNAGNNYRHTWASDSTPDLWLDGLYMILPFRAEYAKYINDTEELDLIVDRMQWVSDNMYNAEKGLFYHAADSATSNSGTFWLRSIGWYAAAIVDIMDSMEGENLQTMKAQLVKLVDGMKACQNASNGMWLNNMAATQSSSNPYETSGTALVCYAVMKAVNEGWLDESYASMAILAFEGICDEKLTNNNLTDICFKGAPGSSNSTFYDNEGKGLGPFIMLYAEMLEYVENQSGETTDPTDPEEPTPETQIQTVTDSVSVTATVGGVSAKLTGSLLTAEDKALLSGKNYVNYIALNVAGEVAGGELAVVTFDIPNGWNANRVVGIHVENGSVKEITGLLQNGKFTFVVSHFSAVGIAELAETSKQGTGNLVSNDGYTYTLDTDGVEAGETYLIVAEITSGWPNNTTTYHALTNNNNAAGDTVVTRNNDGTITVSTDTNSKVTWTFNGSTSGTVSNNGRYVYPERNRLSLNTNGTDLTISNQGSGAYRIYYKSGNYYYYLRYNNGWTGSRTNRETSIGTVYLYKQTAVPSAGEEVIFTVTPGSATINLLDTDKATLTGTVTVGGVTEDKCTIDWTSSNTNVATVSNGTVTGKASGETTITATLSAVDGTALQEAIVLTIPVTVSVPEIAVTGGGNAYLATDSTTTLVSPEVKANGVPTTDYTITWAVTDGNSYVSVNDQGVVTGLAEGVATVTATITKVGEYTLPTPETVTYHVTVQDKEIVGIRLLHTVATVTVGTETNVPTGAKYVLVYADDSESSPMDITIDMLSDPNGITISTAEPGTYESLEVTVGGFTAQRLFALNVVKPANKDYPEYPNPGSVDVNKVISDYDKFQSHGIVGIDLSTSGIPMKAGLDVVLTIDISNSMAWKTGSSDKTYVDDNKLDEVMASVIDFAEILLAPNEDGSETLNTITIVTFAGYDAEHWNSSANVTAPGVDSVRTLVTATSNLEVVKAIANNTMFTAADTIQIAYIPENMDQNKVENVTTVNGSNRGDTNYDYAFWQTEQAIRDGNLGQNNREVHVVLMSDGCPSNYNGHYYRTKDSTVYYKPGSTDLYTAHNTSGGTAWTDIVFESINENHGNIYANSLYKLAVEEHNGGIYAVGFDMANGTFGSASNWSTEVDWAATFNKILEQSVLDNDGDSLITVDDHLVPVTDASDADTLNEFYVSLANAFREAAKNAYFVDQMNDSFDLQMTPVSLNASNTFTPTVSITRYNVYKSSDVGKTIGGVTVTQAMVGLRYGLPQTVEVVTFQSATSATSNQKDGNIIVDGVVCAQNFWYNTNSTTVSIDADGDGEKDFNLEPETFRWNIGTISDQEFVMTYYAYLEGSMEGKAAAGTYLTNNYATLYYENWLGNNAQQSVPSPSVAWKSAVVHYGFYLVDEYGNPVTNRATGATGSFYDAVKVTNKVLGHEVYLNSDGTFDAINLFANNFTPAGYILYDDAASYHIEVTTLGTSHWEIVTGNGLAPSTYVTDYRGAEATNLNSANLADKSGVDYTSTTVWFAVVWKRGTVEDTVVIDFGLPVDIDVMINDMFGDRGTLFGVGKADGLPDQYHYNLDENPAFGRTWTGIYGAVEMKDGKVRYTPGSMSMRSAEQFYYEVRYEDENDGTYEYYYGRVTVIPAATIYYEDIFVSFKSFSLTDADTKYAWTREDKGPATEDTVVTPDSVVNMMKETPQLGFSYTIIEQEREILYTYSGIFNEDARSAWNLAGGMPAGVTQQEDRPGRYSLSDANNIYGYDPVYKTASQYSLGAARVAHVTANQYATAEFTFTGTGFDIIALTSNDTGVMVAQVFDSMGNEVRTIFVDTYWGYRFENGEWIVTTGQDPTDLYQIPIITATGLAYGEYRVVLTASYNQNFDHPKDGGYDLYLDAVRIYDPAGVVSGVTNATVSDAYVEDGEMIPTYQELRDNMIGANSLGTNGAVFIDGIPNATTVADYTTYGPNNELYLAPGQAILFNLTNPGSIKALHIGLSSVSGDVEFYIFNADAISKPVDVTMQTKQTLTTATDMYYDITAIKGGTILIYNSGDSGILSITTLKILADSPMDVNVTGTVSEAKLYNILMALGGTVMDDPDTNPDQDNPGTDEPGTDVPGTDEPGTDEPGTDEPGTDEPGTDEPGTDEPGADNPGTDEPGIDEPTDSTKPGATTPNGGTTDGNSNGTNKTVLIVAIAGGAVLLLASIIVLLKKLLGGR